MERKHKSEGKENIKERKNIKEGKRKYRKGKTLKKVGENIK